MRITFVGFGLLASSVAAAIKQAKLPTVVRAVSSPATLSRAKELGLADEFFGYDEIKGSKGAACTDQIVKHVSGVLKNSFRSGDHIYRLKENEFVVVMNRMSSSMQALVFDKVEHVNEMLAAAEKPLMPVSLSVGVAFSDRQRPQGDIFQDADTALRRMQQVRHCGCAVY